MGDDLIDEAVFLGLLRRKEVVALGILLHLFQRLAGVLAEQPVHLGAGADDMVRVDLDVGSLSGQTTALTAGDEGLVEKVVHPRMEGSDEGTILAVLTEKNDLVGTVRRVEGRLRFVPDDCPAITMPLARDCEGGATDGDKVAVEILNRGNRQEDHRVGVAMRFGSSDEAKRCAKALLYAKDIRTRFPDKVREEAKKFEGAEISEKDCEGRMDLRALPIFTIDSAETKDIDDAVSLTRTSDGGFELGVHIADVSNYVKPGTELDNEAFSRATSVYYADQVVPMLPKALSNGICSLNENELRLAFSCLMRLDKDGNLTDYRFVKSIIRSRVKGVYAEINALLAGTADAEIKAKYADVIDQLPAMKELYGHRARLRKERGCMDIESGEVKLILDENGRCIDVKKRTSGESESMIEEFMLLANQCAAHFARVKQIPFVYRVHEEPNAEKLEPVTGNGPVLAQAILDYRAEHGDFQPLDELLEVRGIGSAKLDAMRDEITTGGDAP